MSTIQKEEFTLIGLSLKKKTTNENNQAAIDCGNLWQQFEKGNYAAKIPGQNGKEIFAVYYAYEGDYTKPYSYFIGCKVPAGTEVPEGMDHLSIPAGKYQQFIAQGKIPDSIGATWHKIWNSDIKRRYAFDFEKYDEKSSDMNNATVEVFVGIQ